MSIKVLRIIARLNIGGPARNAVLLTEALGSRSKAEGETWETVLVCGEVSEAEGDMMYLAREKGVKPIIIKELSRELSIVNDLRAFWKIYRIICKEKPDIIHTHTAKAGTLGRLAGILYNVPLTLTLSPKGRGKCVLVHTFHGHVLRGYFGRLKSLCFIWVEKILALFTDKIVTVSESLKRELIERFRIAPESKFYVVELGFELDELLKLPVKENRDVVNIGIVGRLVPVKNHRMLFRAANRIKDSGTRIKFAVIGDGELREELEYHARESGLQDIVEFKGWVNDLARIYEELDIVVLTSLNEGTPVSIIEAMAAARPVVATKVGGVPDIVQDTKSGYLAELDNVKVFTEGLWGLIRDKEKRKRFGEYGRESVKERFSKDRLVKDIDTLYNSILEKNGLFRQTGK